MGKISKCDLQANLSYYNRSKKACECGISMWSISIPFTRLPQTIGNMK
jgi:hypothetical protein